MRRFILIFVLVLFFSLASNAEIWKEGGTLHIAHRGARALVDENTLEAILKAVEMGVDTVEFDIQRTKDGTFVIMHDETVERTTDGKGRVEDMSFEEFKKLRTKSGYIPPSLEEVLEALKPTGVSIILDIKIKNPDCIPELVSLVKKYELIERSIFESSYPKLAREIEKFDSSLVSAIYPAFPPSALFYAKRDNLDCVSLQWVFATPGYVHISKKKGFKVAVWTVNKKGLINWFEKKLKVDGIMTDDPRLFQ